MIKKFIIAVLAASALVAGALGLVACNVPKPETHKPPKTELNYRLADDGTHYCVTGLVNATDTNVIIPSTHDDKPVTEIADNAFKYKSSITTVILPEGITSIGESAFEYCTALIGISLPDGLLYIGESAFEECASLTSIDLPDSLTEIGKGAFNKCYALRQVNIPKGLSEISENAFSFCTSLTSITIPSNITSIGYCAFIWCYKLVEIYNLSSVTVIAGSYGDDGILHYAGAYALNVYDSESAESKLTTDKDGYVFYDYNGTIYLMGYAGDETQLTLPHLNGKNYEIYNYAFYRNANISSITISENSLVPLIGNYAFFDCYALKNFYIEGTVYKIGEHAFQDCRKLEETPLTDSIGIIGDCAFYSCSSLTSFTVPANVTVIGKSVINACDKLESVTVAKGNSVYYSKNNCIIKTNGKEVIAGCKTSVIPYGILSIGDYAFGSCRIKSVEIPETVTNIGDWAFGFTDLTEIVIPASVKTIGEGAFFSCSSLQSAEFELTENWTVTDPFGVKSITKEELTDYATAAEYLRSTYRRHRWERAIG